jgi:hypothetical protein
MATIAPVITSITFDKASYVSGTTITATVVYAPGMSASTETFTGTATDSTTGSSGNMTGSFTVETADATTVTGADSGNRTWTKTSDSGTVAVFTATA